MCVKHSSVIGWQHLLLLLLPPRGASRDCTLHLPYPPPPFRVQPACAVGGACARHSHQRAATGVACGHQQ